MASYRFKHVALGGTFDLLHAGHKSLIDAAARSGKNITVGVTSDKLVASLDKQTYEDERIRTKNVKEYLRQKGLEKRSKMIALNDIFGTTLKDPTLDAIAITAETQKGAALINKKRAAQRFKKLAMIRCKMILADDKEVISSTRIRGGEISRGGRNYKMLLSKITAKPFSEKTRQKLKKPFGKITPINSRLKVRGKIIAVGDISVSSFLKTRILPDLSIVDFFVNRKRAFENLSQLGFGSPYPDTVVRNEAGQISKSLVESLDKLLSENRKSVVLVDGEEDLAVIPAILLSKLGSAVFYGQPEKGAVMVEVQAKTKDDLCTLLGLG
jgi:cytidyltransferase-like protein